MTAPAVFRAPERRKRRIKTDTTSAAREAIGPLEPGMEVYILTFGQFSLLDALVYLVGETGPADVVIATWTAATADLRVAAQMLERADITRMRWIVDRSFQTRQPEYCERLRELFGDACIRTVAAHAKFIAISAGPWRLAVRTSMNLNENPRLECIEISDDPALHGFLVSVADELFAAQAAGVFDARHLPLGSAPRAAAGPPPRPGVARVGR